MRSSVTSFSRRGLGRRAVAPTAKGSHRATRQSDCDALLLHVGGAGVAFRAMNRIAPEPEQQASLQHRQTLQDLQLELQQAQHRAALLEERIKASQHGVGPLPPIKASAAYPPYHQYAQQPPQPLQLNSSQHRSAPPVATAVAAGGPQAAPQQTIIQQPIPEDASLNPHGDGSEYDWKAVAKTWILMLISTALYLAIGAAVYTQLEGWSAMQSVYFCMVTMSTVGYGDFSPTHPWTKVITIFMILIGVIAIFSQVGYALSMIFDPLTSAGRRLLDGCCPRNKIDIDGDGEADFSYPRHWTLYYFKGFLPSLILNLALQGISAAVFVALEGWPYGDAFYHCFVTATTVGYGDISIETEYGRLWACFHILLSVVMLAEGISTMGELQTNRKEELDRLEQLKRKLDANMLNGLLHCAAVLREAAEEGDAPPGMQVTHMTELEFVVAMLLQLGICKWSHVRPFIKKFRVLDADGSGQLGKEDLQGMLQAAPDGKKAPSRANEHVLPQPPPPMYARAQSSFEMMPPPSANELPATPSRMAPASFAPHPGMYGSNYAQHGYPMPGGGQAPPQRVGTMNSYGMPMHQAAVRMGR